MIYLLDTDSIIDYLKGFPSSVTFIKTLTEQGNLLCVCDVVVAEVLSGVPEAERPDTHEFLRQLEFLSTSFAASTQAGIWRYDHARKGVTLTTADCLIAGVAKEEGASIVTANLKDYPMEGISLTPLPRASRENWPNPLLAD